MRLFLSSQGLGAAPGELVDLLRSGTAIAVIASGAYLSDSEKQRRRIDSELVELRDLGLEPAELDLRDYFGHSARLRSELERFDAVWVLGGNAAPE
jgi:dipeptidase E